MIRMLQVSLTYYSFQRKQNQTLSKNLKRHECNIHSMNGKLLLKSADFQKGDNLVLTLNKKAF